MSLWRLRMRLLFCIMFIGQYRKCLPKGQSLAVYSDESVNYVDY